MPQEQPYLSKDLEPPGRNPDIERAIAEWYESKVAQKRAAATTKLHHATLVVLLQDAGLESYPWTNPDTGRKRTIAIERAPKAKETRLPSTGSGKRGRRREVELGDAVERQAAGDDKIEKRRPKRTAEHDKLADPFGETRGKMGASKPAPFNPPKVKVPKAKRGKRS